MQKLKKFRILILIFPNLFYGVSLVMIYCFFAGYIPSVGVLESLSQVAGDTGSSSFIRGPLFSKDPDS